MNELHIENLSEYPRYVRIPAEKAGLVGQIEGIEDNSIKDPSGSDIFVEEGFLKKHIDENGRVSTHEIGPSYSDLCEWEREYRRNVDEPDEFCVDLYDEWHRGLEQYLMERASGEVSSIDEFMDKYGLD